LANSPQATKRARQAEQRRQLKQSQRSQARTYLKRVRTALASGDKSQARDAYRVAQPIMDRMARKGLFHPNTIARYKSRISAQIKALAD
jgi:small subunit ribosomal protein S20